MRNFTYCGEREHKTTTLLFFFWTSLNSFRIQLQHLTNWTRWNKCDEFAVLFIPSFYVLSDYFYVSLDLVAAPIVWILIKIVTQLLILNRLLFWRSRCLCVFASEKSPWTVVQRKFLMGARENEFHISQNYIFHMKFTEIYLCFHISCEIWPFIFSDSHEKFSLVLLRMTNYIFRS